MTAQSGQTLNGVLAYFQKPPLEEDITVSHLALDSRKIAGGELFIAVPGLQVDGRRFIENACRQGAAAILFDCSDGLEPAHFFSEGLEGGSSVSSCPVISVAGLKEKVGMLADRFYRRPSEKIKVMGVTGTNGKTSCCWYLSRILERLGQPCALMGTVGQGMPGNLKASVNTTSDVVSLQQYLAELVTQSIPAVAMEVSSHGLDQGRVAGVTFEVALFTHISRDHLDYHGTLDEYAAAKARLFSENDYRHAVIGKGDAFSELMISACPDHVPVTTWSLSDKSADVFASHLQAHSQGFTAEIHTPWGSGLLETALLGRFNLENLLAVIAVLGVQGYPLNKVLEMIRDLTTPPGRMQRFGGGKQPLVLVDYAHTPDAIKSVLSALREHGARRLVCVYGCGGDRDPGKRPLMTAAALEGADRVVLTSDNPRSEDPQKIIGDALEGVSEQDRNRMEVVVDRRDAIAGVIARCEPGDIVVVAGKGHENYQEIHGVRHHFDDREQVQGALALRAEQ